VCRGGDLDEPMHTVHHRTQHAGISVGGQISRHGGVGVAADGAEAAGAGMPMTHLAAAFTIAHPGVTSAIIGPRTMGTPRRPQSTVAALAGRLEKRGLLRRADDSVDRRKRRPFLTGADEDFLAATIPVSARELVEGFEPTPPDETAWARAKTTADQAFLALVTWLRRYQRMRRFPELDEVPAAVIDRIRAGLGLADDVVAVVELVRSAARYRDVIRERSPARSFSMRTIESCSAGSSSLARQYLGRQRSCGQLQAAASNPARRPADGLAP
jgi:DNA-binding MarR family transcriptional regulator